LESGGFSSMFEATGTLIFIIISCFEYSIEFHRMLDESN
jgi:hypothetical protein